MNSLDMIPQADNWGIGWVQEKPAQEACEGGLATVKPNFLKQMRSKKLSADL